jgi:hypothetical protein
VLGHPLASGSSSPSHNPDSARPKAQRLGLAPDLNTAFASSFVSRDDFAGHVGVVIGANYFPAPLIFDAMPRFQLHCAMPMIVHARFASVASGVAGAVIVSTSPALNTVAEPIVNAAVVADGAKTIVPTLMLFF